MGSQTNGIILVGATWTLGTTLSTRLLPPWIITIQTAEGNSTCTFLGVCFNCTFNRYQIYNSQVIFYYLLISTFEIRNPNCFSIKYFSMTVMVVFIMLMLILKQNSCLMYTQIQALLIASLCYMMTMLMHVVKKRSLWEKEENNEYFYNNNNSN